MSNVSVKESAHLESLMGQVADEFLRRQESGERPDVEEYVARHPEAAELLRKVLASLQVLEWSQSRGESGAAPGGLTADVLGDFRLLREIGRGGMGVVYEAEQISLGRRVALKVLPFAATMDPRQLQRFHNEARAAAGLEHPHIVPVYGVGCERGLHYYAMKFIDGRSLADFLIEQRNSASSGAPMLTKLETSISQRAASKCDTVVAKVDTTHTFRDYSYFRRIAEWGIQAAEALEYAHSLGIVHRDIKPANLLVDASGRLWVADFGLCRTSSDAGLTMSGDLLGTLRYMSPEQAQAKHDLVDHRSDVYSFGATLYELLTLQPAFGGANRLVVLRQIGEIEPAPARKLNTHIPRDLETIVLRCLEKDPTGRYPSAKELADDLRRFLVGEPVRARRVRPWEKAGKWVRRRPTLTALVAVVILSVVALVAGLFWHNNQLRAEAEKTARERDSARKAQRSARRAVNDMYSRVGEEWLADAPHMTEVQREFLTKALDFYEETVRDPGAEPEDRLELGRAHRRIPHLRTSYTHADIEKHYREAVRILEGLVAEFPDNPEYRLELVRSWSQLGHFLLNTDQMLESEQVLNRATAEVERLQQADSENPEYRLELATAKDSQVTLFIRTGRLQSAKDIAMQSRHQARWLVDHSPTVILYREVLATTSYRLGLVLREMNQLIEAEKCFREILDQLEPLAKQSPTRLSLRLLLAFAWRGLAGVLLEDAGTLDKAEQAMVRAVSLRRRSLEDYPTHPPHWHALGADSAVHGCILARQGRFPEAEAEFGTALTFQERIAQSVVTNARCREELAVMDGSLAWLKLRQPSAATSVQELLPRLQRARDAAPTGERFRLTLIGLAHYRLGEWKLAEKTLGQTDTDRPMGSGSCRWTTDDHLMRRIAEHQEEVADAVNAFCLAMSYHRLGQASKAMDCYRRGLRLSQAQRTPTGFRSVDVDTIQVEAEALLGLR
jgi:serine/threonine protein kinase/tetratricopeptide (TPR) repeat protein